jgi:BTB/POZ domain
MFSNNFTENATGQVLLPEIKESSIKLFLSYLYNKGPLITHNVKMALDVLEICHKYEVGNIFSVCVNNIVGNPDAMHNLTEVLRMFHLGKLFGNQDICERAAQWLMR